MLAHSEIPFKELHNKIRQQDICYGGNRKLKIYGRLSCASGKKMKKENRVFFHTVGEAVENGYHPCGHCMKEHYQKWKNEVI